ncbi:MAG TPA: GTP-binding protein [Methylophaga aminisulfidivorans]|uniref:CobW family GTP-binding protein n=1 Tax=Methylophaga TaxID=40222 RepID=UPI00175857E4|nr:MULTISPECIES: GTP-binding protein [Methylophaga]HIC47544.1 GTP-binding protein [Methylophaga sp.]HIM39832.1 GTP-binding protein [Methylophaga aminisulfidivorans]
MSTKPRRSVPTNIITGFLGVGKTTSINHLLAKKPVSERWAVLVNEFGQIGLDKTLLEAESASPGLLIKEVPGGCMCCSAGLPVTVALNQILREVKPDRLLIEPSGLGHPKEILEILSGQQYQSWIELGATITLVDARHFNDERYTTHNIFLQQLAVADLIVVNKYDKQNPADLLQMQTVLAQSEAQATPIQMTEWGQLSPSWLDIPSLFKRAIWQKVTQTKQQQDVINQYSEAGIVVYEHQKESWASLGFRFDSRHQFDEAALLHFCGQLNVARIKAVVSTQLGTLFINQVSTELNFNQGDAVLTESLIEFISITALSTEAIKAGLSDCLIFKHQ